MLSSHYYGQRKRARQEQKGVLLGGAGAGRGGAGRGRGGGAGRGAGRGGGGGGGAYAKHAQHAIWNHAAAIIHYNYSTDAVNAFINSEDPVNPIVGGLYPDRIAGWDVGQNAGLRPWPFVPNPHEAGGGIDYWNQDPNDATPHPGPIHMSAYRIAEIGSLQARGAFADFHQMGMNPPRIKEARWAFLGMSDATQYGLAWSCFYFGLSDLYVGHPPTMSAFMVVLMEVLMDVMNGIGAGVITPDMRCMVAFEGTTDVTQNARHFIQANHRTMRIGHLIQDPMYVLNAIIQYFASDAQFSFRRVYIHMLTRLGGGGLDDMPSNYRSLREGALYGSHSGFTLIEDPGDGSCGIEAVIFSMTNAMKRMKKHYGKVSLSVPEICKKFQNFSRYYADPTKSRSKIKLLYSETRYALCSAIGWQKGQPILPDQLCEAVRQFAAKNRLDLGLLILDAIHPLSDYYHSYNPEEHVPLEVLCLILWQYPSVDGNIPGGHYDCINRVNLTSWLQKHNPGERRKDLRYSFRQFRLLPSSQADDKGGLCLFCKHWQRNMSEDEWTTKHGGAQGYNTIQCEHCLVLFKSTVCFQAHLKKSHGNAQSACDAQAFCKKCERVHIVAYNCDMFYCEICCKKFPITDRGTHTCYLSFISEKKKGRLQKVMYADMESSRINGVQEAVCIAACWTQMCAEHEKIYNKQKPRCKACRRNAHTWGYFCSMSCGGVEEEKRGDYENYNPNECKLCQEHQKLYLLGKNCLSEFLGVLELNFMGGTVVFHNGGKFDMHILYVEILKTGAFTIKKDAARGNQIIFMTAYPVGQEDNKKGKQIRFIDSCAFIASSLRSFPSMFALEDTDKGRFPYDLLNQAGWETYAGKCPSPTMFGITPLELRSMDALSSVRKKEVKEILDYIDSENKSGKEWKALEKLKEYTLKDCIVLHDGCEIFRRNFWESLNVDPFRFVTLASAVAGSYRQPPFMKENCIQVFDNQTREWQRQGLRGGKCEVFKLYWKKTKQTERIYVYDINSEYPFVQAYKHYPYGKVTCDLDFKRPINFVTAARQFFKATNKALYDVLHDASGEHGCGIIECEIVSGDAFYPILPFKVVGKQYIKNMFMNRSGKWIGFINVLASAVSHRQVIVQTITRIQYWANTSNTLFRDFLLTLYKNKVEASGWEKILNEKCKPGEEKSYEAKCRAYTRESLVRGVKIDVKKVEDNPGKRSTSKICANCGWGYMCQKPHANENLYFDNTCTEDVDHMESFLDELETEKNPSRLMGVPVQVGKFTKVRTTKKPQDITRKELNKKVAYHVGGQVPAHGLVLISEAILTLDPSQPCYTDTDCVIYVHDSENPRHKMLKTGMFLGDFVDEYPDYECVEWASTGTKSYFMKLKKIGKEEYTYKGRFKGIPLNTASYSLLDSKDEIARLGMEEMITIIRDAVNRQTLEDDDKSDDKEIEDLSYEFHYTNFFKRCPDHQIRTCEEKKTIRFTFDKREVIHEVDIETRQKVKNWAMRATEINTRPKNDGSSCMIEKDIDRWWVSCKKKLDQ